MTQREQAKHLASRQKKAEQIIIQLERFKVCDQCRSISYKEAAACSVCGAYRFNSSPAVVRKTAREMGDHPFPVTSGIVPRLAPVE